MTEALTIFYEKKIMDDLKTEVKVQSVIKVMSNLLNENSKEKDNDEKVAALVKQVHMDYESMYIFTWIIVFKSDIFTVH